MMNQLNLYFRELIAIKLLELAMFIAPKKMELAIARGIVSEFKEPVSVLQRK